MCEVCAGYSSYNCPVCGEEVRMMECPDCKGTGEGDWKVLDIEKRVVVRCPQLAYDLASETEDMAHDLGKRFCRESNICQTCKGEGQIPM